MNNNRLIVFMGWVTLIVFPLGALLALYLISGKWQFIFQSGWPLYQQIPIGIALGLLLGFGLRYLLELPYFKNLVTRYGHLIKDFNLSPQQVIFLSVCAGVGEEILFRGCIQYYAGIYLTAFLFVALHGYLNPLNLKISVYGSVLTIIFVGVGFLMEHVGLYSCIILHIIIDIILFRHLLGANDNKNL